MGALTGSFQRLLIANRGEIAARIARAARAEDITPLGVYSEADGDAPFLDAMEDAAPIGAAPATASYLNIERIVAAARTLGAQAVHPGYGFLSERPAFAQAVIDAGLIFVGPPPSAMLALGDKSEAKRRARACGIPVIAGYDGEDQSPTFLREQAEMLGTPLLLKASAGGGGRGMRVVHDLHLFDQALHEAKREALAGFGDDRILLERFLAHPRHIEFQILADAHGNIVHIGERDCSIQRRHQKILEEAPAPGITPELRSRMGEAAVRLARSAGYVNAGTVEFLLDESGAFSFLEMNARLQVEHPITEEVYGIDLVRRQLRIAAGERLSLNQEDIVPHAWAFEARINAEEPTYEALPESGTITAWIPPDVPGLRMESGVRVGSEVTTHYDGLLAKLIVSAPDRESAIKNLTTALETMCVGGVATNLPLLLTIAREHDFRAGGVATTYLEEHTTLFAAPRASDASEHPGMDAPLLLGIGAVLTDPRSWRIAHIGIPVNLRGPRALVRISASLRGDTWQLSGDYNDAVAFLRNDRRITAQNQTIHAQGLACVTTQGVDVFHEGRHTLFTHASADERVEAQASERARAASRVISPMPGKIVKIAVRVGDTVRERDLLIVLEAMKMEHGIEAPRTGIVEAIHVASGAFVAKGVPLLTLGEDGTPG